MLSMHWSSSSSSSLALLGAGDSDSGSPAASGTATGLCARFAWRNGIFLPEEAEAAKQAVAEAQEIKQKLRHDRLAAEADRVAAEADAAAKAADIDDSSLSQDYL